MPHVAPRRVRLSRSLLGLGLAAALAVGAAGCRATTELGPAQATPTDMGGIAVALGQQGVTVDDVVSGDAGCPDAALTKAAISFKASGVDQPAPVQVHLYIFRNDASYQKLRSSVDTCARSFLTDPNGYEALDASPFVLTGQGPWPAGFKAAVRRALQQAAAPT